MRVYLAGPMRGLVDWNFKAFDECEAKWKEMGHTVFNPANLFRAYPYLKDESLVNCDHLVHVINADLACIYVCDAIGLLYGWEKSMGASVELAMSQFLGLKVYDAHTLMKIDIQTKPWSKG